MPCTPHHEPTALKQHYEPPEIQLQRPDRPHLHGGDEVRAEVGDGERPPVRHADLREPGRVAVLLCVELVAVSLVARAAVNCAGRYI